MQRIKLFASIVAVLTTMATAVSAAPALTLSRSVGPPKTTVTAKVSGFAAGRTVDVYFDTTAKCLVVTSSLGSGSCTLRVPTDAQPETHWISAVLRYTGTGAQKSFIVRTDWAQFHGNANHDGYNQYENTINPSNVADLAVAWATPAGGSADGSPVVANGKVYIRDSTNLSLNAYDAKTGAKVVGFPVALGPLVDESAVSPAVYGNIVLAVGGDFGSSTLLRAFNATTGAKLYAKVLSGEPVGAPLVVGGKVFQATAAGKIDIFTATTGNKLTPMTMPSSRPATNIVIANGVLYVATRNATVQAFNVATTAPLATQPVIGNTAITSITSLATAYGKVFGTGDAIGTGGGPWGRYFAFTSDGGPFGYREAGANYNTIRGTPAFAQRHVISVNSNNRYNATVIGSIATKYLPQYYGSDVRVWFNNDTNVYSSPIVANGVVYVNTDDHIVAYDFRSGALAEVQSRKRPGGGSIARDC